MKALIKFSFWFILIFSNPDASYCQEWVRTVDIQNDISVKDLKETYDHGIIIGANIAYGTHWSIGWIIKLDVNGNILWDKKLGDGSHIWQVNALDTTTNGGIIVTGTCDTLGINNAYLIKLNACGDVEWCRIYHAGIDKEYGVQLLSLKDGTYILVIHQMGDYVSYNIAVQMDLIDADGNIFWEKYYFPYSALGYPYIESNVTLTPENKFLISGKCYHTISGQTQPWWIMPMLIMADSTGESDWELPWGNSLPFGVQITGEGFTSIQINSTIYTAMSNYHWPNAGFYSPCLIRTTSAGTEISYKDLIANTSFGKASTISKLSDSVLLIGSWYTTPTFQGLSILKTDTLGNIIKQKVLNTGEYIPSNAWVTHDKKYLVTCRDHINYDIFYLYKLNENLEYDSIYTAPRTYDSLCPYPITSSTLFSTCDLATSVQEPAWNTERVRMHLFPNPASSLLHVQLPEAIQKNSTTAHLQVSTVFHRWNKPLWLTACDMFSREVYREEVYLQDKEIQINVSSWPSGLYLFMLSDSNTVVAEEKAIVE